MDDHLLDRIYNDIKLCLMLCLEDEKEGIKLEGSLNYEAARELIKCYNKLVDIYYKPEFVKEYRLENVAKMYKNYKFYKGEN